MKSFCTVQRSWWGRSLLALLGISSPKDGCLKIGTRSRQAFQPQLVGLEDRWCPATLTVTNTLDDGSNGSLRWAVGQANSTSGTDSIVFDSTAFATAKTITLGGTELALSDTNGVTTITGSAAGVTISGGNASRVFDVNTGVTASLSGLTIAQGKNFNGGGVFNGGTLTLTNSVFSGNSATYGAGVFSDGTLTLTKCTVSGNTSIGKGGGIDISAGTATLTNSTISGNSTSASNSLGAGVYIAGGTTALTNCTVSGNTVTNGNGGGINSRGGTTTLTNCTVSGNNATGLGNGGGMYNNGGTITLTNTIVAGNSSNFGNDLRGAFSTSSSNNFIGDGNSSSSTGFTNGTNGNQVGTFASPLNPLLAPLGNNGGPTQTMALLPGSPAIDAGTSAGAPTTDQRGVSRFGNVDIGAFEFLPTNRVVSTTDDVSDGDYSAGHLSLREAVFLSNLNPAPDTITFDPTVFATAQTITLGGTALTISDKSGATTTITGSTAGVTVSGGNTSGVFQVNSGGASLSGLTITQGKATTFGGGGVFNASSATLMLTNCTVSGNTSSINGGGVDNYGTMTLTNCTISGNTAVDGGGVFNFGPAALTNCTVSGNTATNKGGGVYNFSGTATLTNTIVAQNTLGTNADVFGAFAAASTNNLIGDGTGSSGITNGTNGNQVGTTASPINPLLGSLGNNGGSTQTMALLPGSPAINAGTATGAPTTDQRGIGRFGKVDIGAFEFVPNNRVVSTIDDVSDGDYSAGHLSFREAIFLSNTNPGPDAITFDPTAFAGLQTITLSGSALTISDTSGATTITSPAVGVKVNGNNASGVFVVNGSVAASLSGMTITNGSARAGGGILNDGTLTLTNCTVSGNSANYGGGVASDGTLTLTNCTVSGNSAFYSGGVANRGLATLTNCTVSTNTATQDGGGVYSYPTTTLTLTNCTVSGNSAKTKGGGVLTFGTATLTNCTVSGNSSTSDSGGGVYNTGTATIANSSISNNSASYAGGGMYNAGTATLSNCTVSGNSAGYGAGMESKGTSTLTNCTVSGNSATGYGGGVQNFGTATLNNTIVAGNIARTNADMSGSLDPSSTNNLIGDGTGSNGISNGSNSNQVGTTASPINPILAQLGNYGGPTQTMALLPGSPAIDAGSSAFSNPVVEVQTVTISGSAGTFALTFNGATTSPLAFNATAPQVQTALNNLSTISGVGGSVTVRLSDSVFTIIFGGTLANQVLPQMTANGAGGVTAVAATVTIGLDQRSLPRIVNGLEDIGAFESEGFTLAVISGSGQSAPISSAFANPLVATVTPNNPSEPVAGGVVTFTSPPAGASATFTGDPAIIAANGTASVHAIANTTTGTYSVSAMVPGITVPANFSLTNIIVPTAPVATISRISAPYTSNGVITYTITYTATSPQTITLTAANVVLNKSGSAKGTVTVTTPAGGPSNVRIVTIANVKGDGALGISLKAGTAITPNGLKAAAAGPSATVVVDNTTPAVSIGQFNPVLSLLIPVPMVSFVVTVSDKNLGEAILSADSVSVVSTSGIMATKTVTQIDATHFLVTLSKFSKAGMVRVSILPNAFTDMAGNTSAAVTSNLNAFVSPS